MKANNDKTVYPYIPNSAPEVQKEMMDEIGITDMDQLYEEIPEELRFREKLDIPPAILDEYGMKKHIEKILDKNTTTADMLSFLGAGCANHYVPAVVDEIITRGELLTCYGSDGWADHGKFQIFAEYNSMICELLGTEALSVPQYDGGQALATSICMANRINGKTKVLLPKAMNPQNKRILANYLDSVKSKNAIEQVYVDYDEKTGCIDTDDFKKKCSKDITAAVIMPVNFFGVMDESAAEMCALAKEHGAEAIVYVDPITLGLMEAPTEYGADIVCGDIHSLGIHQASGGGQAGFISTRHEDKYLNEYKDYMYGFCEPEIDGELVFGILLNYRTHYSQRAKGKEYTGTGKNLWMAAASVYMALMGAKGFEEIDETILYHTRYAEKKLSAIDGISLKFAGPTFGEIVVDFSESGKAVSDINKALLEKDIMGGVDLSEDFPELGQSALYSITEITGKDEIDKLAEAVSEVLE